MPATDVVGRQVEAQNSHDLEAFLSCYADDVQVLDGAGDALMTGIPILRARYLALFATMPDLVVEVRSRLARGAWVVDDEHVTAPSRGLDLEALRAYHVQDGLIDRVVVLTEHAVDVEEDAS